MNENKFVSTFKSNAIWLVSFIEMAMATLSGVFNGFMAATMASLR